MTALGLVQKIVACCLVTVGVCMAPVQLSADAKPFKKFLKQQERRLTLHQKMQIAHDLLSEVERLHQDEPIQGPITLGRCLITKAKIDNFDRYVVSIKRHAFSESPNYSISHHVQNVGGILGRITSAKKYPKDKKSSMLPTYKRFKQLISYMKNPDVLQRKSICELKLSIEKNMAAHRALRRARKRAHAATNAIMRRCKKNGMKKSDIFNLALFIESEMQDRIEREGKYYFSRRITGLKQTIEVDPRTKNVYIHLKGRGVKELGHGARKVVNRSIMYSQSAPKYVAFSETTYPNENETKAIIDLQGLPGLYKVISVLDRKDKDGNATNAFISKYYSRGDLAQYMKSRHKKLSFNEKIRFARDIMVGLESMHVRGYSHRDLGLRNYFVERRGKKIVPVIADFGRAALSGETTERGAQGGFSLCAPEGLDYNSLKGDDYLATDIYALGCVFYRILFSKKPSWHYPQAHDGSTVSLAFQQEALRNTIESYRKKRSDRLGSRYIGSRSTSSRLRFEKVILKMIDPNPAKRGTATELRQMLDAIVKRIPQ